MTKDRSAKPRRRTLRRAAAAQAPRPDLRTLDRVLSRAGLGSRTQAAAWIREGRARVNGRVVKDPETWLDAAHDRVTFDGKPLEEKQLEHYLLYKPKGVLVSRGADVKGRRTVYDLLPDAGSFIFPVGRLDLDSSGLLIMTNDSDLAERLTNPSHDVAKTYHVKASSFLADEALGALASGVELDDGPTRPARVTRLRDPGGRTVFEIVLTEGRNRQVRRMVEAVGSKVLKLVRVAIGPLRLGEMQPGQCRRLTPSEVRALSRQRRSP